MDKRWQLLGEWMVRHSAAVQSGERVMIAMSEVDSYPLTHAIYEAVIQAGGYPQVQFLSESLRRSLLKYGSDDQLSWVPEMEAYGMEWADVYFGLRGAYNLYEHSDVPAERLRLNQVAQGKVSSLRWQNTRWCLTRVPNAALAFQAQTDLETITDMYFNACLLDWKAHALAWRELADRLNMGSRIRIVGKGTDLRFSVEGRRWIVLDGRINMPDGEVMTAPVTETIDGHIYFEFPGVLGGRLMNDIRLGWKNGRLVQASASSHEGYLHQIVESDAGASLIGEFAIGLNPFIDRFSSDILLDEKMGGTVHIALGRAYPECGGTNQSAIHWDIVKDLRSDGAVYLDDQPIMENGRILI